MNKLQSAEQLRKVVQMFAAGLVAGEGTCGLVLACLALAGGSLALPRGLGIWGGVAALALVLGALVFVARNADRSRVRQSRPRVQNVL